MRFRRLRPDSTRAGLEDDERLAEVERERRQFDEAFAVANILEITAKNAHIIADDERAGKIAESYIGFVAGADENPEPQSLFLSACDERRSERAALRDERDVTGLQTGAIECLANRRDDAVLEVDEPDGIGTDEASAFAARDVD